MLAEATGIERTWIHRKGSKDELYRQVVLEWLQVINEAVSYQVSVKLGVNRHLQEQADRLAAVFSGKAYLDLMRVLIRDGGTRRWIVDGYELRMERLAKSIVTGMVEAGQSIGVSLLVPLEAALAFLRDLETIHTLPALHPRTQTGVIPDAPAVNRACASLRNAIVSFDNLRAA